MDSWGAGLRVGCLLAFPQFCRYLIFLFGLVWKILTLLIFCSENIDDFIVIHSAFCVIDKSLSQKKQN